MHVEVRNACASEEICACKSKCLALGHGIFLDILPHEVELFYMADEVFKHQNSILINAGYFKARLPGEMSRDILNTRGKLAA